MNTDSSEGMPNMPENSSMVNPQGQNVPDWVKENARSSKRHLVFQGRLKRAMHVLRENNGSVPAAALGVDAQWLETVRQIMLETGEKKIIGSGCLNDNNVIELMLQGYDENAEPANIFLRMNTSDVRHRAMLRHMGDVDMPKNLMVPILPFPYGFF